MHIVPTAIIVKYWFKVVQQIGANVHRPFTGVSTPLFRMIYELYTTRGPVTIYVNNNRCSVRVFFQMANLPPRSFVPRRILLSDLS